MDCKYTIGEIIDRLVSMTDKDFEEFIATLKNLRGLIQFDERIKNIQESL